jgi:hypothetical protein
MLLHYGQQPEGIKLLSHHVIAKQHAAKTLPSSCFA